MIGNVLKIAVLLVVVAASAIGYTLFSTQHMIETAEAFQQAALQGDTDAGLGCMTRRHRTGGSDRLQAGWQLARFNQSGEIRWERRAYRGGQGHLSGVVSIANEGDAHFECRLRHRDDSWRIERYTLVLGPEVTAPPEAETLFGETHALLAASWRSGTHEDVLAHLTKRYRTRVTQAELIGLLDQIGGQTSVFGKLATGGTLRTKLDNGRLELSRRFVGRRGTFDFHIVFGYEDGGWKTDGLRVVRPTEKEE